MKYKLLVILLFAACARADEFNLADRVRMLDVPPASVTMESTLQAAAEAASDEDLAGFLDCFTADTKKRLRNKMLATFLQHSVDMTIVETHMLYETKTKGELAVKYNVRLSEQEYVCISKVACVKDAGGWKISSEKLLQRQVVERRQPTCVGGRCRF